MDERHARDVVLVGEVAQSSLVYDRGEKTAAYDGVAPLDAAAEAAARRRRQPTQNTNPT